MPAESKSQQRFMGMVHAYKKGTLDTSEMSPAFRDKIRQTANHIKAKDAKDMAETKHKGLPEKVAEAGPDLYNANLYKIQIRERTIKERLERGFKGTGIPSAALTGLINLGFGSKLRTTASAAAMMGVVGTVIGTALTPKKKKVLTLANNG